MEPLGNEQVRTYTHSREEIEPTHGGLILAARPPHRVRSYRDLLAKVAALAYHNSHYTLLFRGQSEDFGFDATAGEGRSALYPSIFRTVPNQGHHAPDMEKVVSGRFAILRKAEDCLNDLLRWGEITRNKLLRRALLQHYEVCPTPLLDVTPILGVAVSFAFQGAKEEPLLCVFAVPHLTGIVSTSVEAGTQTVRLAGVCPPTAFRPHFQDAILIGDYPDVDDSLLPPKSQGKLRHSFACRLLAKFQLPTISKLRKGGFSAVADTILRPDKSDEYAKRLTPLADTFRPELERLIQTAFLGRVNRST